MTDYKIILGEKECKKNSAALLQKICNKLKSVYLKDIKVGHWVRIEATSLANHLWD